MNACKLSCSLGALLILASAPLPAHGGVYRGPGDIVPPGPGGGHPRSGRPAGPTGPRTGQPGSPRGAAPTAPATGVPGQPSGTGGSGPARTPRGGAPLPDDFTSWSYWWEFNKHAYIGLRDAVHRRGGGTTGYEGYFKGLGSRGSNLLEPTRKQIQGEILPALKRAIDSTEQRDIVSSCMVAMAKIGENHTEFRLVDVFAPRLKRNDQEIRETAALAMGISAVRGDGALDNLIALSLGDDAARELSGRDVTARTRAFALYGLGLFANEHSDPATKRKALDAMAAIVDSDRRVDRNVRVAAIQAIGMLAIDRSAPSERALLDRAVDTLLRYYERPLGPGDQLMQAHCPTAITKLIGPDHARSDEFRQRFAEELDGRDRRRKSNDLARSAVLSLGRLCQPHDDDRSRDAAYSKQLASIHEDHKDQQTRYFALLALGQIGGDANRQYLLRVLRKGNKQLERPWAALALGVMCHRDYTAKEAADEPVEIDRLVGEALTEQLRDAKAPELCGALGVGLGLARYNVAAARMEAMVAEEPHKEQQAGYLCLGLALMRERRATETIQRTMETSTRRTTLFVQAAIALGLLGDKSAAQSLHAQLEDENTNLATLAAIAEALGQIGDRRSVLPLTRALHDDERAPLQRAFAAVALGAVADRAPLPWHAEISADINYRAAVETLTNSISGVLDIL